MICSFPNGAMAFHSWKSIERMTTTMTTTMTIKKMMKNEDNYNDESWDDSVDYDSLWKSSSMSNPLPTSEWNDDTFNIIDTLDDFHNIKQQQSSSTTSNIDVFDDESKAQLTQEARKIIETKWEEGNQELNRLKQQLQQDFDVS
jgi:hypothetical protein